MNNYTNGFVDDETYKKIMGELSKIFYGYKNIDVVALLFGFILASKPDKEARIIILEVAKNILDLKDEDNDIKWTS